MYLQSCVFNITHSQHVISFFFAEELLDELRRLEKQGKWPQLALLIYSSH